MSSSHKTLYSWNLPVGGSHHIKPSGFGTKIAGYAKADLHQALLCGTLGQLEVVTTTWDYYSDWFLSARSTNQSTFLSLAPLHQHSCSAIEKFGLSVCLYKEDKIPAAVTLMGIPFSFCLQNEVITFRAKLVILRSRLIKLAFATASFQFFSLVGEVRWPSYQCRTDTASKK